jgi:hypothetical protein
MVSVTDRHSSCGTSEKTVELARQWAQRAVLSIVRESGGQTVARPVFRDRPDLDMTVTENESLGGLQAAVQLKHAAMRLTLEYARQAREDGHSWQEIGVALGFVRLAESDVSVASAAYDYAVGTTALGRASFAWVCPDAEPRCSTMAQRPGTRPTARMATPTTAHAWPLRSRRGTTRGTTRPGTDSERRSHLSTRPAGRSSLR